MADDRPAGPAVPIDRGRPRLLVELRADAADLAARLAALADATGLDLLAVGPRRFHLVGRRGAAPVAAAVLRRDLGAGATVVDLTGGYPVLTFDGPDAVAAIRRAVPLDPEALPLGDAAGTLWHGVPCLIHRTGETSYDVAIPASHLEHVRATLA